MPDDFDFRPSAGGQEPSCTPPRPFLLPHTAHSGHSRGARPARTIPAAPLQPPLSAPASYAPPVYPAAPQPPVCPPAPTPYMQQPYPPAYGPPPPPYSYYPKQPGYMPPPYGYPAASKRSGDGLAVASLILGILSVAVLIAGGFTVLLGIVGLVLGILAKSKGSGRMAVAGIVLSSIGLALFVLMLVLAFFGFFISHEIFDDSYRLFRSLL